MQLVLPQGVSETTYRRALSDFAGIVGEEWVLETDLDRDAYSDAYAMGDGSVHAPSAALAPASVEEVQAIVRVANAWKVPLWPISRGKNLGYGGSAPALAGTIVLDLSRMNRILEVDPRLGVALLEPGVGFFDLHRHLAENDVPLWMSLPGNAWGSVVGNALDRGFSASPYGEHVENLCGLEVVLPDASLLRTGTGAMAGSATWPLFKYGFGPAWDQLFVQSNMGVITKAGYWLMPEPEAMAVMTLAVPRPEDLGWLIDALLPLRLRGIIGSNVGITNYIQAATTSSQRSEWYQGDGALPDDVVAEMIDKLGVGWWNVTIRLHGLPETVAAHRKAVEAAIAPHTTRRFTIREWRRGEASGGGLGRPAPTVFPLQIVNWHGGRGGHVGFSPALPASGARVLEQLARTRARYRQHDVDFGSTFYLGGRHVINVNLMLFDRDDEEMTRRVRNLFTDLVRDAREHGYGEYRTHLSYMDEVAGTFDFNDHALARLNRKLKDLVDPNGVIAPGKSGIWGSVRTAGAR